MFICFIGDSLTLGTGDPEHRGWPGRLAQMSSEAARAAGKEINVYNLGIRGNRSNDILERWLTETARRLPEGQDCRLVFCFGGADASRPQGYPRVMPDTSMANARLLLQAAKEAWPTLWLGPTPMLCPERNQSASELNKGYSLLARTLDIPYLNIFTPLSASQDYMNDLTTGDGVHPGAAGYGLLAEIVAGWDAWRAWLR